MGNLVILRPLTNPPNKEFKKFKIKTSIVFIIIFIIYIYHLWQIVPIYKSSIPYALKIFKIATRVITFNCKFSIIIYSTNKSLFSCGCYICMKLLSLYVQAIFPSRMEMNNT